MCTRPPVGGRVYAGLGALAIMIALYGCPAYGGDLSGRIFCGKEAAFFADVKVVSPSGETWLATADVRGHFEVGGLGPGCYTVQASWPGCDPDEEPISVSEDDLSITLQVQVQTRGYYICTVAAVPPGREGWPPEPESPFLSFSGTVLDDLDEPIKDVQVSALTAAVSGPAITTQDGNFTIEAVRERVSELSFSAPGYRTKTIEVRNDILSDSIVVRLHLR